MSWAGKEEEVSYRNARAHLHPRKSFEIWKERTVGKSIPWLSCEIQSALELRTDVLDITLSITEKKRAADLERQFDALNTLSQQLLVASDAAMQASQRKSEMVSVVSHDLRAPLTSIKGALSLLKNGFCEIDKAEGAELVEIAYTGSNYLLNLVNDLLNLETIESGGITLEKSEVPVSKLIDDAFQLVRSAADLQGIKLASEVEVSTVWADKDQLLKVLVNLISNAIKFSPEHSRIVVSAQSSHRGTTFKVTDQGRGIPSQFRQSIFQRFTQVETADRNEKGGAGLGLAICKAAVEAHGGSIGLESEVSKGSTFWFSLPPSKGLLDTDGTIDGAVLIEQDITDRRKVEQVLQESEERYRLIVAGVKDYAIFMLDRNGLIQTWSDGAERIKGYGAAEIIGKHFSVFYTQDDQRLGLPESQLKIAIAKGRYEGQGWRLRKDGSSFFADVVITPLFGHEGSLSGFTKITRDITNRMLVEQEIADARSRLSLALQSAAVGVWDLDLVKNSAWHSLRHDEIFGHQELLTEWNFGIFVTYVLPEDRASAKEAFQLGLGHGEFSLQCRIIRASDKAVRWISMRGETFRNEQGDPMRMMGTVLDITDIKDQEEQQRLLAIMNEREDFMATLTHDMKNPIIGANRLLEMFVAGRLGALSSKQCELLQHLRESNAALLKLIENLIDVYRFEQDVNVLVWTECDLVLLIASCLNRITTFANLRSIKVISQLPEKLVVRADARRLERVVQNLLDNALKFTPDDGTINVRLLSLIDNTIIEIEDNGPGIAPEDHSRLFKRFSQGRAGKRHTGGSGLGLYLCKQIIEAHGGTIECKSQPNIATIFRLNLPKDDNKTQQAPAR